MSVKPYELAFAHKRAKQMVRKILCFLGDHDGEFTLDELFEGAGIADSTHLEREIAIHKLEESGKIKARTVYRKV